MKIRPSGALFAAIGVLSLAACGSGGTAAGPSAGATTRVDADSAVSATQAITTPNFRGFGAIWLTIIRASGAGTVTATFGAGFLPTATVAPTTGKSITVGWVSDGVVWREYEPRGRG